MVKNYFEGIILNRAEDLLASVVASHTCAVGL